MIFSIEYKNLSCLGRQKRFLCWRSGRDLNPRAAFDGNTISSRARYDHFDTTAYKMLPQQHGLLYQKSAPCQAKSTKKPINFGGGPLAALLHAIPSVHLLGNGLQRRIHCVTHPLHGFAHSGFSRLRPGNDHHLYQCAGHHADAYASDERTDLAHSCITPFSVRS